MSSFGTKKPGADRAVQLTFPAVFSEAVAPGKFAYYPEEQHPQRQLYATNDLQGQYHQQKMMDAHRMANAKVQSTRNSNVRFLKSHANYDVPKPVLSQRRFANPSNGNQADIYNNRNVSFDVSSYRPSELQGGVLYTSEAQKWGRQKLFDRIAQLDSINAEKEGFVNGLSVQGTEGQEGMIEGSKQKLELVQTLRGILQSVEAGKADTFTYSDTIKFLRLLFRFASDATLEDLENVLEYVDYIIEELYGLQREVRDDGADEGFRKATSQFKGILEDFERVREYLANMVASVNLSVKERKLKSASLIKSLGFTNLNRRVANLQSEARKEMREGRLPAPAPPDHKEEDESSSDEEGDDDDERKEEERKYDDNDYNEDLVAPDLPSPRASSDTFHRDYLDKVQKHISSLLRVPEPSSANSSLSSLSSIASIARPSREAMFEDPFSKRISLSNSSFANAKFDPNPRERMGRNNGRFFGEQDDLAPNVASQPAVKNDFRHGNGEDQNQGLEVEEVPESKEAVEDLRERLGDEPPKKKSDKSAYDTAYEEAMERIQKREAEEKSNAVSSSKTLKPQDARGNVANTFRHYTEDMLRNVAKEWKSKGFGTYVPRAGTDKEGIKNGLRRHYNL